MRLRRDILADAPFFMVSLPFDLFSAFGPGGEVAVLLEPNKGC
jgi:hypothetical protein